MVTVGGMSKWRKGLLSLTATMSQFTSMRNKHRRSLLVKGVSVCVKTQKLERQTRGWGRLRARANGTLQLCFGNCRRQPRLKLKGDICGLRG